jgi:hypothetical protein
VIALVENNPRALQGNSAAVSGRFSDGNVPLNGQRTARAAKARPTIEELREYLDYDPKTGVLTWKKRPWLRAGVHQNKPTSASVNGMGYKLVQFGGCKVSAHRVAFALHHGRWPMPCCDHIDGDKTNNRADNLRECSVSANAHNGKMHRDNATGVKGVSRHGSGYLAEVMINGAKHRKWFRHLEDAAAWVRQTREQLHGEFARHE